ncbi:MAG: tyrosine-type recombinase/integrase [Acidimicrobiales bacterium]
MNPLRGALEDYLAMRQALGYKLERPARLLGAFVTHLEERDLDCISTVVALDWAMCTGASSRAEASTRLSAIRLFARYAAALDDRNQIPPGRLLPSAVERKAPYLFSDEELDRLMAAARSMEEPFRALSLETLIGVLACTGLRPGEACGLGPNDLDLADAVLVVRDSKWESSRLVPLHHTAAFGRNQRTGDRSSLVLNEEGRSLR